MHRTKLLALLLMLLPAARAEVKLPAVFSDHMVLQRDLPVPVWGTAAPGEFLMVEFAKNCHFCIASMPFYRKLADLSSSQAGKPIVSVSVPEGESESGPSIFFGQRESVLKRRKAKS